MKVEFVSYDGSYPNLCAGTLVIKIDGKEWKLDRMISSGGSVSFTAGWEEVVCAGPWGLHSSDLPKEIIEHANEILECVNDNIPYGCCGGCV